jgi:hypothetical protein
MQAVICPLGKSINGKCKKFNQTYDKLIAVSNVKGVSIWGCKVFQQGARLIKVAYIQPFTEIAYLNKLSIGKVQFMPGVGEQTADGRTRVDIVCFAFVSRAFKFSITL